MSPNVNYDRGRAFEYRTRDRLEANGYTVFRTAGSRSLVDLIAFQDGTILFVQCKSGKGGLSKRAKQELAELAERCGAIPCTAYRGGVISPFETADG